MRSFGSGALIVVAAFALTAACRSADEVAKDAFRTRLKQEGRLTTSEITQLFDHVGPAIAGKSVTARQGAVARELTSDQRIELLDVLADPTLVYDVGLRTEAGETWRGITGDATPTLAEVTAMKTLWIDVASFVPRRYEFAYSTPGLGEYAYDLTFK